MEVLNKEVVEELIHKISTKQLLQRLACLQLNICVISPDKITLVIADNKINNKNVSSFVGSSKIIKLGTGLNKNAVRDFEKFLKRNATCGARISVFAEGID